MLPPNAVEDFNKLLLAKDIKLSPEEVDKLANDFLQFVKILLKGSIKKYEEK